MAKRQFYRFFGYQNNVYNSNFQNRQSNASVQPRQLIQIYPNSDFKTPPERRQGYPNSSDVKNQFPERRPFGIYDGIQQSRQQLPFNYGNRQTPIQPKIEKVYQFPIINENLEHKKQKTSDPAFLQRSRIF